MTCELKRKIIALYNGVYAIKGFEKCTESYKKLSEMAEQADNNKELGDIGFTGDQSTVLFWVVGHNSSDIFFTATRVVEIANRNVTEENDYCMVHKIPNGYDTMLRVNIE